MGQIFTDRPLFLSTLSLRRATKPMEVPQYQILISIHALLAESDSQCRTLASGIYDFYPRSPCGERLDRYGDKAIQRQISIHALLAESDVGAAYIVADMQLFLSTLSLRRATAVIKNRTAFSVFLSTLSLRRATPVC